MVTEAALYVRRMSVIDSLALAITNRAKQTPMIYPFAKTVVKTIYVGEGCYELPYHIISNILPTRCIVALCNNLAYNGEKIMCF